MPITRLLASALGVLIGVCLVTYALRWIARGLAQLTVGVVIASTGGLLVLQGLGFILDEFEQNKDLAKARKSAQRRMERMRRRAARTLSH